MSEIRIKNWSKFQHFNNRRPPWIKLYRDILDDPDWHALDPESSKILVMLWLIASEDPTGALPPLHKMAFRLRISENILKSTLCKLENWLDINMISTRYHDDTPERERETEADLEAEADPEGELIPSANATGISPSVKKSNAQTLISRDELKPKKSDKKFDDCPQKEIIELYHEILVPPGTRVAHWTTARARNLKSRWHEKNQHKSLDFWETFFKIVTFSAFLMGEKNSGWREPYRVSLDSIIAPKMFYKIVEFQYHSNEEKNAFLESVKNKATGDDVE